jgi:hypothetical protein
MDEERVRRIAVNEAVFRELNDQLEGLARSDEAFSCVCECGDISCVASIPISHADYRRLREDPTTFAIEPGHAKPDVEDVIAKCNGYEIVQKKPGLPAAVVREMEGEVRDA